MLTPGKLTALAGATLALGFVAQPLVQADDMWTTDVDGALAQAKADNKDVLMDFTGSDWCGWCMRLNEEVFDTSDFRTQAPEDFVLVKLDFPQEKELSPEVQEQNQAWAEKLAIQGFPTIVLLDGDGVPYASTGYQEGGSEAYLTHLDELKEIRAQRDAAFDQAANASGLEKAKLLDQGLDAIPNEYVIAFYKPQVETIVKLDANNEAGLKEKYESLLKESELQEKVMEVVELAQSGDTAGAKARVDELLKDDSLEPMHKQGLTMVKAQIMIEEGDAQGADKIMQEAIDLDPDSEIAEQIRAFKQQLEAFIQMQQQQQ